MGVKAQWRDVQHRHPIAQLVWIAPRGLITVLLFLGARHTGQLETFPFGAVMLVVLVTSALTALAHRAAKAPATDVAIVAPSPMLDDTVDAGPRATV